MLAYQNICMVTVKKTTATLIFPGLFHKNLENIKLTDETTFSLGKQTLNHNILFLLFSPSLEDSQEYGEEDQ